MKSKIESGIYIVINPAQDRKHIIAQLSKIKSEPIAALQIWDPPDREAIEEELIEDILELFKDRVPVLINNQWELLKDFELDGVHFDQIPKNYKEIENELDRDFIKGITLNNDLNVVEKANDLRFDYLSFCAMFPSKTSNHCELVHPETVRKCRKMTRIPIFLAGGITPESVKKLKNLSFQGVAVVSGIMDATNPKEVFKEYELELKK